MAVLVQELFDEIGVNFAAEKLGGIEDFFGGSPGWWGRR